MNQNRNYEKEVLILQQEINRVVSEKVMIQAFYDDALEEIEKLKKQEPTQ